MPSTHATATGSLIDLNNPQIMIQSSQEVGGNGGGDDAVMLDDKGLML